MPSAGRSARSSSTARGGDRRDPLLRWCWRCARTSSRGWRRTPRAAAGAARARFRLERLGPKTAVLAATEPARRWGTMRPASPRSSSTTCCRSVSTQGPAKRSRSAASTSIRSSCRSCAAGCGRGSRRDGRDHRGAPAVLRRRRRGAVRSSTRRRSPRAATRRASRPTNARRFERAFITPMGHARHRLLGPAATADIPAAAIDELDRRHLISAEQRAGARWYELTHDRLIEPVRAANRARRAVSRPPPAPPAPRSRRALRRGGRAVDVRRTGSVLIGGFRPDLRRGTDRSADQGIDALALILPIPGLRPVLRASFSADVNTVVTLDDRGGITTWNARTTASGAGTPAFPVPTSCLSRRSATLASSSPTAAAVRRRGPRPAADQIPFLRRTGPC